jgi:Fanconi anemia group D2 protein
LYRSLLESTPFTPSSLSLSQEMSQSTNASSLTRVSVSMSSDSVIKLMLKIPALQPKLLQILLEKLPEFSMGHNMEAENDKHSVSQDAVNLKLVPKLILHQLRWMDFFVESGNLSQELLNCLDVCDGALKLDIISLLPEIISDAESGNIVEKLKDLMSEVR